MKMLPRGLDKSYRIVVSCHFMAKMPVGGIGDAGYRIVLNAEKQSEN